MVHGLPHIRPVKVHLLWFMGGSLLGSLALAGCNKSKQENQSVASAVASQVQADPSGVPPPPPAAMPPGHPPIPPGNNAASPPPGSEQVQLDWVVPKGWEEVKSRSMMRKATYRIPPVAGDPEPGELAVFYFGPNQGGGVEDNLTRWVRQFKDIKESDVKRSERTNAGLTHHIVEVPKGTFSPGMGRPGASENFGLLGAVVESPSGKYFFKLWTTF